MKPARWLPLFSFSFTPLIVLERGPYMPPMRKANALCIVMAVILLGGCSSAHSPVSPSGMPTSINFTSPGYWEIIRKIDYRSIPKANLKGDNDPAYRLYLVTVAGFHSDTFGITAGPDDDVRYTTDGGQSWTRSPNALHCRHGLEIVNEYVAWHCGNGGTRVSIDGGQTWKTKSPSACPYMSFLDAQTGWTASPASVQATHDGGTTWINVSMPLAIKDIAAIAFQSANTGYVLDTDGNLFVTVDEGKSWDIHSLGLKKGEQLTMTTNGPRAALRFFDPQHGMVIFDLPDRTVWFAITSDGGKSWQRAEIPELRDQSYYYHLFLSHDGSLLTATDNFDHGKNTSILLKYRPAP
jgi:photosystem II stability/assembly factor-like uncharacterized protein